MGPYHRDMFLPPALHPRTAECQFSILKKPAASLFFSLGAHHVLSIWKEEKNHKK